MAVILLVAGAVDAQIRQKTSMDVNVTGTESMMLCAGEQIKVSVTDRHRGTKLDGADIDVYYGSSKILNLESDERGEAHFVPEKAGTYRVTAERSRYYDNEVSFYVEQCIPTTTTSIFACPLVSVNPALEADCIESGGTVVAETTPDGCKQPPKCHCNGAVSENWTCQAEATTTVTTTISQRQVANDLFNSSMGYYDAGDYNKTREQITLACDIYRNISDLPALEECEKVLDNLPMMFETPENDTPKTTLTTIRREPEKQEKRNTTGLVLAIVLSLFIIIILGSMMAGGKPKSSSLGGQFRNIIRLGGKSKLEEI